MANYLEAVWNLIQPIRAAPIITKLDPAQKRTGVIVKPVEPDHSCRFKRSYRLLRTALIPARKIVIEAIGP